MCHSLSSLFFINSQSSLPEAGGFGDDIALEQQNESHVAFHLFQSRML
jgi:hypothetical protein